MFRLLLCVVVATYFVISNGPLAAEPADTSGPPLTLQVAIDQALAHHPDLKEFEFRLRAQSARMDRAGLKPAVEFRGELENFLGTDRVRGVHAAEATFALSSVLELGDKRDRRIEVAQRERELIEIERAAVQLDVLAEVTRRFIHVASDQEQLRYTVRATELADDTVQATQVRLAAGLAPEVEMRRARVLAARARLEQEHAEHELLASRRKLAAMWGSAELTFGAVETDLYALADVGTFDILLTRLEANPDFERFASQSRLRDAEIRLAAARGRPDVTYSAGIRRLQEMQDQAFVAGISIPLFSRERARHAIEEATALRSQTDAQLAAHRVRVEAQLFELHQELRHAVTEATVLRTDVVPEMEAALEATRYAFDRGRYGYVEWVAAQRELIDAQRSLVEASTNAHLYLTEIERLTGVAVTSTNEILP